MGEVVEGAAAAEQGEIITGKDLYSNFMRLVQNDNITFISKD